MKDKVLRKVQIKPICTYPKRSIKPYISAIMPIRGHPRKTIRIPIKKNDDALILFRWKKNKTVFFIPIIKANPDRNNN